MVYVIYHVYLRWKMQINLYFKNSAPQCSQFLHFFTNFPPPHVNPGILTEFTRFHSVMRYVIFAFLIWTYEKIWENTLLTKHKRQFFQHFTYIIFVFLYIFESLIMFIMRHICDIQVTLVTFYFHVSRLE